MKKLLFGAFLLFSSHLAFGQSHSISLAGKWSYRLDPEDKGIVEKWQSRPFSGMLTLPGTLDDAGIGEEVKSDSSLTKNVMLHLSRKHTYIGVAWYQRTFTTKTGLKEALLSLERVIWRSNCWVDGQSAGTQQSLIAPHQFKLGALKAGKHTITIRIDNRRQHDISVNDFAHAYTDGTQIIWNGVIGKMEVTDLGHVALDQISTFPSLSGRSVKTVISLSKKPAKGTYVRLAFSYGNKVIKETTGRLLTDTAQTIDARLPEAKPWDEFHPRLYRLKADLFDENGRLLDSRTTSFGFRDLKADGNELKINGRPLFLRGTLECNIFPLEGHPPMQAPGWKKVFLAAKAYGLNHLRFHSWCPPEAAFQVADSLGFYLHVELPLWVLTVGKDAQTLAYLKEEAKSIVAQYGNHPSFCFWSMGNELEGDFGWLEQLVRQLKSTDNRHLYTTTTFSFQNGHGKKPEPADDFFITQYTEKGWVRGQGIFNTDEPDFKTDYIKALAGTTVPLIIHEVGQYSIYPDLKEIGKYTGVLRPDNFKAVRNDLRKKQMLPLAERYLKASGGLAVQLYKEEIERALKTKGVGGFQLLDLHDFPGQGTALVGILNAFWESKGLIEPDKFREFCGPVVPLLRFDKAGYMSNEIFRATAEVANYSDSPVTEELNWSVISADRAVNYKGTLGKRVFMVGNGVNAGEIKVDLSEIQKATQLTVSLKLGKTKYQNEWKVWVYPAALPAQQGTATFTSSLDSAINLLQAGKSVVFHPDTAKVNGIDGRFATVFWSPVHFPNQPGSMGLLIDDKSLALASFPTASNSDWQWWDLVTRSRSLELDRLPVKSDPIIRVIDNFFRNRNLGTLVEFKVGAGKLLICTMDISHQLEVRPAARQLRYSLAQYASDGRFQPSREITIEQLTALVR